MGGKYWWEDKRTDGGYILQQNIVSHHCRIIDMRNVCIYSGSYELMNKKLDELIKINKAVKIPAYGDVIGVNRGLTYDHYGIYENDNSVIEFADTASDMGNPVIHKTTLSKFIGSSTKCFILVFPSSYGIPGRLYFSPNVPKTYCPKAKVAESIGAFVKAINLDASKYLDYIDEAFDTYNNYHLYTPEQTVQRAKSCIGKTNFGNGEGEYALHRNNCEHFAIWCKTGLRQSLQAEGGIIRKIRAMDVFNNEA